LSELYVQRNALGVGIKDNNPRVREIDAQIASERKVLRENLKNIISSSDIVLKDLRSRITKLEREISSFPKTERELINIQRKFELNEGLYTFLMQRQAEAGIAMASNLPDNKIIDDARILDAPIKPKGSLNYAIALLLGLIVPAGFVLGRDYFDNKIKGKEDVESVTRMPIAAMIGHSAKATNTIVLDS